MEPFIGIPIRNFFGKKRSGGVGGGRGEWLRSDQTQTQTQREVGA